MISLRNYFRRGGEGTTDGAGRRLVDLFLQGIALHAVQGDAADYAGFRADIDALATTLTSRAPHSRLYSAAEAAVRSMEAYNGRTNKFVRQQKAEVESALAMLTQTADAIEEAGRASAARLDEIEQALHDTDAAGELSQWKLRLGRRLESIREALKREQAGAESLLAALREKLRTFRERMEAYAFLPDLDLATGLPSKEEAARAIRAALASPNGKFLVVAVVGRLQAINARFGYAVGDQVLTACAEHFRNKLSAGDQLYRWNGPALLAIVARPARVDQVRAEVRKFAARRLEKKVSVRNRIVLLPIATNWSVMQIAAPLEELLNKVDTFIAVQVSHDYA